MSSRPVLRRPATSLILSFVSGAATAGVSTYFLGDAWSAARGCGAAGCAVRPFWGLPGSLFFAACVAGIILGGLVVALGVLAFERRIGPRSSGFATILLSSAGAVAYGGLGLGVAAGVAAGASLLSASGRRSRTPSEWSGSLPVGVAPAPPGPKRPLTERPSVLEWKGVFAHSRPGPPLVAGHPASLPSADRLAAALEKSRVRARSSPEAGPARVVLPPPPTAVRPTRASGAPGLARPALTLPEAKPAPAPSVPPPAPVGHPAASPSPSPLPPSQKAPSLPAAPRTAAAPKPAAATPPIGNEPTGLFARWRARKESAPPPAPSTVPRPGAPPAPSAARRPEVGPSSAPGAATASSGRSLRAATSPPPRPSEDNRTSSRWGLFHRAKETVPEGRPAVSAAQLPGKNPVPAPAAPTEPRFVPDRIGPRPVSRPTAVPKPNVRSITPAPAAVLASTPEPMARPAPTPEPEPLPPSPAADRPTPLVPARGSEGVLAVPSPEPVVVEPPSQENVTYLPARDSLRRDLSAPDRPVDVEPMVAPSGGRRPGGTPPAPTETVAPSRREEPTTLPAAPEPRTPASRPVRGYVPPSRPIYPSERPAAAGPTRPTARPARDGREYGRGSHRLSGRATPVPRPRRPPTDEEERASDPPLPRPTALRPAPSARLAPKPEGPAPSGAAKAPGGATRSPGTSSSNPRTRAWRCPSCRLVNAPWSPRCTSCQAEAPTPVDMSRVAPLDRGASAAE